MDETNKQDERTIYEIGYHVIPTVGESEVPLHASELKSLVEEKGGTILSEGTPRMTNVAYDISKNINSKRQKFNKTYFGWVKFEADQAQIADIKSKVKSLPNILRFLIIKTVRENTMHTPKPPIFKKEAGRKEKEHPERPKISEAEIDKSIDELMIS